MADPTPALRRVETALRDLLDRLAGTDPRRGMCNRLLFKVADKFGGTATEREIKALEAAVEVIEALPDHGAFREVLAKADRAVAAVTDPPRG